MCGSEEKSREGIGETGWDNNVMNRGKDGGKETGYVGLPYLPYFTGDPVFQTPSPASQGKAAGKNKSPVFC